MALFGKTERLTWKQINLPERIVLLSLVSGPKFDVEWLIQRALCYHKLTEITPLGLKLTRLGRRVMAERHGLPVVVGRDTEHAPLASAEA